MIDNETIYPKIHDDIKSFNNTNAYWDTYYTLEKNKINIQLIPSQFAAFCATEIKQLGIKQVIEIASGDGRDCVFFAQNELEVIATENSDVAITSISKFSNFIEKLSVAKVDAINQKLPNPKYSDEKCAYYARFFIHTLPEAKLQLFLKNLSDSMRLYDYFYVEYRNTKDKHLTKVTPQHYRNFFKSSFVKDVAKSNNLKCLYEVEGIGFAKYKLDDAYVTRQIFQKV